MQNEVKQVKFDLTVYAVGIKKRCRKPDRHSFSLGSIDFTENLSESQIEELIEKAKGIVETNMKQTQKADLNLYRVEYDGGFKTMQIFDPANKKFAIPL